MEEIICSRKNCSETNCVRYSREFGYICEDCFAELVAKQLPVEDFLSTPKLVKNTYLSKYDDIFKVYQNKT